MHYDSTVPALRQLDILREDMFQAAFESFILDVGWYPSFDPGGRFRVVLS